MPRIITSEHPFLEAKGATGVGDSMNVADYRHIVLFFATDGGADAALTAKVQGSVAETEPTWGSAQSVTNRWDYVSMYDLNDPSSVVTGDTGFSVATADDYKQYLVNVDGLRWLNVQVTARTQGELTVYGVGFTNE